MYSLQWYYIGTRKERTCLKISLSRSITTDFTIDRVRSRGSLFVVCSTFTNKCAAQNIWFQQLPITGFDIITKPLQDTTFRSCESNDFTHGLHWWFFSSSISSKGNFSANACDKSDFVTNLTIPSSNIFNIFTWSKLQVRVVSKCSSYSIVVARFKNAHWSFNSLGRTIQGCGAIKSLAVPIYMSYYESIEHWPNQPS